MWPAECRKTDDIFSFFGRRFIRLPFLVFYPLFSATRVVPSLALVPSFSRSFFTSPYHRSSLCRAFLHLAPAFPLRSAAPDSLSLPPPSFPTVL